MRLLEADTNHSEADWIVSDIAEDLSTGRHAHEDIALMYRTHASSRALEEALLKKRIPYRIIGSMRFYDRAEIKDALAYLRFLANPADAISLGRLVNNQLARVGARSLEQILECRDAGACRWRTPWPCCAAGPRPCPICPRGRWPATPADWAAACWGHCAL